MRISLRYLVVSALFLSGCAGTGSPKIYKSDIDTDNLIIRIKSDDFDAIETTAYIRKTYDNCSTEYLGKVELSDKETKISLPDNQRSFVTIILERTSAFGDSSIRYGSYISSRKGYRHEFHIEYIYGLYDSVMYEVNNRTNKKREIKTTPFEACRTL